MFNLQENLPALMMQCYQQKSRYYPLIVCRMAEITLQCGIHEQSALGFCGFALAYATVFQNVSEGYRLGKYALAVTTDKNKPAVYLTLYGMINIWKEPMQAVLPSLRDAHRIGLKVRHSNFQSIDVCFTYQSSLTCATCHCYQYGKTSEALINAMLYTVRAFLSGTKLSSLGKEVSLFVRQCVS